MAGWLLLLLSILLTLCPFPGTGHSAQSAGETRAAGDSAAVFPFAPEPVAPSAPPQPEPPPSPPAPRKDE
jgi:hypothetical protein